MRQRDFERALVDFRVFLWFVWKHLLLPSPTVIQYDIADYLQSPIKDQVIQAFRGVGKSYITGAYALWSLLRNPHLNIMVVSASGAKSNQFTRFCRQLIDEMELLRHLQPRKGQQDSMEEWSVAQARAGQNASVKAIGLYGQMTGFRADIIIPDDVEVPKNSETQLQREKLADRITEFAAILKPDPKTAPDVAALAATLRCDWPLPVSDECALEVARQLIAVGSKTVFLGTPQTEDSLYSKLPEQGYQMRIWPARLPLPKQVEGYGGALAPIIQQRLAEGEKIGVPTDPDRFHEVDLQERELKYGKAGFALQFMLDTSLADADRYPLKLSDLVVMDVDPDLGPSKVMWGGGPEQVIDNLPNVGLTGDRWNRPIPFPDVKHHPYEYTVLYVDPSGRGKDEFAVTVLKALHGQIFLRKNVGYRDGFARKSLEAVAHLARDEKAQIIYVEPNLGAGAFTELLKPVVNEVYPCTVEDSEWRVTQKEKFICDTLEPLMMQHKLIVDTRVIRDDFNAGDEHDKTTPMRRLFYQMTRITRDRGALQFDDRLDSLAGAVAQCVQLMAVDANKEHEAREDEAHRRDLEEFVERASGGRIKYDQQTWTSEFGV